MVSEVELLELLPIAVYVTDGEGRITFYNEAAAELWGHRPELGSDRWCGSWRLYWPDGRPLPHDQCPMAIALKEGRPVRGVEAVAERPDGTRVNFLPYPTPLKDAAGRVTGAINLLVDITERLKMALDLERLAAIVSSSDDAIVSKSLDGVITSWNDGATRIFGYAASEMVGQHITRIIPPELHSEEEEILAKLRRGERVEHYETTRVAKSGRRVHISLAVSPLRNKSGAVVGASKVARDITERKEAEQLQRLLIDELNHRVKNTIASVQAIASQSLLRAKSPADFVAAFNGRIQAMVKAHTLLTQTKMQGAEMGEIVRDQVMLGTAADDRISCSGPLLMLEAQPALHLALVLHELATNARKYGALSVPDGHVKVSWELRRNGGHSLILRWHEASSLTIVAPRERGFGTILIQQTLQAHGGNAAVSFDAHGISCEIMLPLPQELRPSIGTLPARKERSEVAAAYDRSLLAGRRVLVIEDEPLLAMDVEAMLTAAGCEVVGPAGTIEAAKHLIEKAECDAALVDVNLAGHPVDELVSALARKGCPLAFMTGYGRQALPQGFQDAPVLAKPFSKEQLLALLGELLGRSSGVVAFRPRRA